ncbi:MAG: RtcB family protein [Proteobacteria bacterium]|nr:RtcB family protein [Pseudomonadota bacterium]
MKTRIIHGTYCDAVVYTVDDSETAIDQYAQAQIKLICDNKASEGAQIRVMPDVHPGKVGPIGLTMTVKDRILPSLVGVDIGCGMTLAKLSKPKLEFPKLDAVIRECIPTGAHIHAQPKAEFDLNALCCVHHIRQEKALCSLGTLGGGNHFIELDRDENDDIYIIIHSGSRHLGKETAELYLREGQKALQANGVAVPYEMTWLETELKQQYIHDVSIVQNFAQLNRETILKIILKKMKWKLADDICSCIHNFIDCRCSPPILRKGAISAQAGECVIIPIHMKDGVILGSGKGNPDWNQSAPHGSGRLYKREDAYKNFSVSAYKKAMSGIYSSCIGRSTLDESPFCYRNLSDIQTAISDTVTIHHILRPIYNYKDSSKD